MASNRLPAQFRFPQPPDTNDPQAINAYLRRLIADLDRALAKVGEQVNELSEGRIVASYNAVSSTPSTKLTVGDFVRNSHPVEEGTAGSKYVVLGWSGISASSTVKTTEVRGLTGN